MSNREAAIAVVTGDGEPEQRPQVDKRELLLLRWHNLAVLRGRVGQPDAIPASKLIAEEAVLLADTRRTLGFPAFVEDLLK